MKLQRLVAISLCLLLSALLFAGCGKTEESKNTDQKDSTTASVSADITTALQATSAEKTVSTSEPISVTEAFVPEDTAQDVPAEPQYCNVIVDGNTYTAQVGDTVDYVFNLKTPEALEDFQATVNYDGSMLELVETDLSTMFPVAGSGVICNTELQNTVKFNAIDISGMDFTGGGVLINLRFRVLDSGSAALGTTLEYMDSVKGEPYVSDYKIVGDFEFSEEIK